MSDFDRIIPGNLFTALPTASEGEAFEEITRGSDQGKHLINIRSSSIPDLPWALERHFCTWKGASRPSRWHGSALADFSAIFLSAPFRA